MDLQFQSDSAAMDDGRQAQCNKQAVPLRRYVATPPCIKRAAIERRPFARWHVGACIATHGWVHL
eukprot:NODE_21142_length_767_cov_1.725000.p6 GENE.NODE_21142_length_767_cov_1.725000~~NODE_21142_length_767_cov_1.725000.p6  ORF type:complete len:65 (+),score=16.20 NODE_21142_length_767_cov_1.725000:299-493(+)